MSPEQLDKARADEAERLYYANERNSGEQKTTIAARLAREGWTPPAPISPRLRAAREWLKGNTPLRHDAIDSGSADGGLTCRTFLAGVAWAVEKAEPVVGLAYQYTASAGSPFVDAILSTYRQEIGEPHEGQ